MSMTPGQAAYEAYMIPGESEWGELDKVEREHWEAIAQAAIGAASPDTRAGVSL